jgi:CRP/FNR family cyclic AMP-dependent transcriptional regulator
MSKDSPASVTETLRAVPLFSHLRDEELGRVSKVSRRRNYPKNSVILFEDDPGDALYVVVSGQVKVVLIGEDGREVILSTLKDSEFFGEMALIDDQPRSAHVILRRDDFHQCLEATPRIALGLLQGLSKRLRQADHKIGGLVLLDVNGRVARLLLEMADDNDGRVVTRRLTHHMIAQMIGSSRETVSRTMRNFVERKLIEVSGKRIVIRNRPVLEAAAGHS